MKKVNCKQHLLVQCLTFGPNDIPIPVIRQFHDRNPEAYNNICKEGNYSKKEFVHDDCAYPRSSSSFPTSSKLSSPL